MQFFTPELYLRFNSRDREEALRADAEWEEAVRRYDDHISKLKPEMSSQVRGLSEICLHDAEVIGHKEEAQATCWVPFFDRPSSGVPLPLWNAVAALFMKQDDEIVTLFYCLCDHIQVYRAPDEWPFSKERKHWLYDEVDRIPDHDGPFVHRILFSSGDVLEIPFVTVFIYRFPQPTSEKKRQPRESA